MAVPEFRPPTRQIFSIRDAVGAQFIAPMLVREASGNAGLMRGTANLDGHQRYISASRR